MRRVLRCDGIVPQYAGEPTPAAARQLRAWLTEHGARPDLDVVAEGETPRDNPRPWAEAGCTWWLETRWDMPHHSDERMAEIRDRIAAGPPRP